MSRLVDRLNYYTKVTRQHISDYRTRPLNWGRYQFINLRTKLQRAYREENAQTRHFDYAPELVANNYIVELDKKNQNLSNLEASIENTGYTIGYPAWNLLYYSLYTSLYFTDYRTPIIVETGTNWGLSTIIMAQVLKDLGLNAKIKTVEIDEATANIAKENAKQADVSDYIEFYVQDSLLFLRDIAQQIDHIDFIFLDGNHDFDFVKKEFDVIYPLIVTSHGKVYFDNTARMGVKRALKYIKRAYGGNLVEFRNCSWSPPGNAIWQP